MANYNDEKWRGIKINELTIIGFEKIQRGRSTRWNWICRCSCGTIKSISPLRVLNGNTTSCGCAKRNRIIEYNRTEKVVHGYARNGKDRKRIYRIWRGMKERCSNKNSHDYMNYGGRGISVCDEWKNSFEAFNEWASNNGYADNLSLDRIDVNGNYCPENCKWATMIEQQRNRQNTERFEYLGEKRTIAEISQMTGISYGALYHRLHYYGWSLDDAVTYKDGRLKDYRKYKKEKQA